MSLRFFQYCVKPVFGAFPQSQKCREHDAWYRLS